MKSWAKIWFAALLIKISAMAIADVKSKPLLVIEDAPANSSEGLYEGTQKIDVNDFPRLLLMQISKSGVFRCIDHKTYRMQARELAIGESDDATLSSAGRCISWVIRGRQGIRGTVLTVSLGYNNISQAGNGELIKSEDVVVREHGLKGSDLLVAAAKKSARAIVFGLCPSEVLEVEKTRLGKIKVIVSYGNGFFTQGDDVYFVKKIEKKGHVIRKKIGIGTVVSTEIGTSTVILGRGSVEEGNEIELKVDDGDTKNADMCPDCGGRRTIRTEIKCGDCNGQGKLWHIKGRLRTLKPCVVCKGKGTKRIEEPCVTCGGTGRLGIR